MIDIILALKIVCKDLKGNFKVQIKENNISTIKADYLAILDLGSNNVRCFFVSKVPQDDIYKHNSQFNRTFKNKYYVKHEAFVAEALSPGLKKIIIIQNRRKK